MPGAGSSSAARTAGCMAAAQPQPPTRLGLRSTPACRFAQSRRHIKRRPHLLTATSSAAVIIPANAVAIATVRDAAAAGRFLHLLDPSTQDFTFQTFDDDKSEGHDKVNGLARTTADRNEVVRLYEQGAGVFVTINDGLPGQRSAAGTTRVRAVWQEDDSDHGGPFPLEPSLVVESSPGHFHRYWLVADNSWPADDQGRKYFASVMERMVESYGSDKNAKDISRVLRLPGFLHRKNPAQPHMVRLVEESGRRYSREEILRAFPPVERKQQTGDNRHSAESSSSERDRIEDALRFIPPDDRYIWLQVGMALKEELGDSGRSIWDRWSEKCSTKFNDRDQSRTWRSFRRHGIGIGTLFHYAKQ